MTQLLIIGGSDAGISAALRAKELDSTVTPTIVMADSFPNFSICGLPFYLSGEVANWQDLAHRTADEIAQQGIHLLMNHTAQAIDPNAKAVTATDQTGQLRTLNYDKLIIGTGATSIRPQIAGLDLEGVYLLRWMSDSFAVQKHLTELAPSSALIIGGGYIGVEMADALTTRGLSVTLVERSATILKTVDPSFSQLIAEELQHHGVEVINGVNVIQIERKGAQLIVYGSENFERTVDLIIVSVGVRPSTQLAQTAGVTLGVRGAIRVDREMQTNVTDIYAAGDCAETWHRMLKQPVYLPLGTTAHKQGRIAGENAVGGCRKFYGSLGTQVVKVLSLAIACTGLRDDEAIAAGFDPVTIEFETWDHKVYYPGAHELIVRVTGDAKTGQLLGAQMLGHYRGEIAKRIDIFATALFYGMRIEDLSDLDLSYTPPLSSPWDPVQMSAQAWTKHQRDIARLG